MRVEVDNELTSPELGVIRQFQTRPPIDVSRIAAALGIRVWEALDLGPEISGKLFRDPHNGNNWSILVRSSDPLVRKRFTVAHEISHYILHRSQVQSEIADDELYRSGLSDAQEVQANRLAADILMPYHLIQAMIASGTKTVRDLATAFQVSETAMTIRLGIPIP